MAKKEWMIVVPAYGRTYYDNESMRADWDAGKDFQITGAYLESGVIGQYMSKRDVEGNTMNMREAYAGVLIVQRKRFVESGDERLVRVPYLTEEITW